MLNRLVYNTLVSAVVFGIVAVLGLVVVSIIIKTWGFVEFGLIVLIRLLMPSGMLALIDLGIGEVTTNTVARAREHGNWDSASRKLTLLAGMGLALGVVIAAALWFSAPVLAYLLRVDEVHQASFVPLILATALANLILLPGLVAEGIIKGFERHALLRWSEFASTVAYVGTTAFLARNGAGYEYVAYAFLAATVLRSLSFFMIAALVLRQLFVRPSWADGPMRRELFHHSAVLFQARLIGIVQGPAQPIVISTLFGPAATGLYEVLVRLPRFARVISSLLTSALLPVVSRLHEAGRNVDLKRIGSGGLALLPALTLPPLAAAAVFSEEILLLWLGPTLSGYGIWMGLAFVTTMAAQFILVGNSIAISRAEMLGSLNRLGLAQILVWALVTAATVTLFEERAFIVGQLVATVAILPLQMSVLVRVIGSSRRAMMGRALRQVLIIGLSALLIEAWRARYGVDGPLELCVLIGSACLGMWVLQAFFVFGIDDRATVLRLAVAGLPVRAGSILIRFAAGWRKKNANADSCERGDGQ